MRNLAYLLVPALAAVVVAALPSSAADDFKPEDGFKLLFNGKNLDGWKAKGGDALEGMTEAFKGRFKVDDGTLVIDPKVKGDVRITTVKELGKDLHLKFDFKPGPGCNNDLFYRGLKFDLVKGNVKNLKEGEWNEFEIVAKGKTVEFINNGEVQRKSEAKVDGSVLEIRAEFGTMQIRRMRFKETP